MRTLTETQKLQTMKRQALHNEFAPLGRMAESFGIGLLHHTTYGTHGDATTRQKKHELLITFMANANTQKRKAAPKRPKLLTALLSIFF